MSDLRKNQVEILQEGFDDIDGVDPDSKAQAPPSEPTITTNINPSGAKAKKKKKKSEDNKDEQFTCQYCGKYDPTFDDNSYDMHCFQECAMLCECPGCSQMLEIPDLNYHLANECDNRSTFKLCPRCKEPIPKDEHSQHVEEELCNMSQNPAKAN